MFWLVLSLFLFVIVFFGFSVGFLWLSFFSLVFQRFLAACNVEKIHRWRKSEERTPPQKKTKCVQNDGKTFKITSIVDENHEVDVGILNISRNCGDLIIPNQNHDGRKII